MDANTQLNERRLADAWAELHTHAVNGNPLYADAYRLAFADPEFLFRRETRGIRFQLEMLKPDLGQAEQGIENTVVVYGSARFVAPDEAAAQLAEAEASGDEVRLSRAQLAVRNARYYD
ncbi:MAG TPA: 3-isopropylmalate dehydrogenase, partial [Acidovorax sp.]|nr:3-isopropylmalate dehydrogenase [Acidovorax sp.]